MEYLLSGTLKVNKSTEFYAMRIKNKDQEKTKGFFVNDEDNPDMPFSRKQWAASIEQQFYQKFPSLMFCPLYIDKKEYAFFFSAAGVSEFTLISLGQTKERNNKTYWTACQI